MEKKSILIVDDEPAMIEMVRMRLEADNYEVISAAEGQQGLDTARSQRPDLIISLTLCCLSSTVTKYAGC